ncbi:MAG: phosphate-starvation-inducible PsiE family protein [Candidatus Riflebacteria bacterium]|nr:phosphate-starvation-inducible PsiE family protein [Candidatus Riflebacteria bacterium]
MLDFLKKFERFVIMGLIGMMVIVVILSTIELCWIIIKDIVSQPVFLLEIDELMEIFGFFLLVLIGIELLETIKAYMIQGVVHVEIVLEVALIAIARKIIILDIAKYDGLKLLSLAALILTVSIGFFIVKRFKCEK